MQQYLPLGNRLNENNLPDEYFMEMGKFQVHIDYYKHAAPKARILLFLSRAAFLLVHPEDDRWTDISLSRLFFDRLACEKEIKMLIGAGHFPLEPQGLEQMEKECLAFVENFVEKYRYY